MIWAVKHFFGLENMTLIEAQVIRQDPYPRGFRLQENIQLFTFMKQNKLAIIATWKFLSRNEQQGFFGF